MYAAPQPAPVVREHSLGDSRSDDDISLDVVKAKLMDEYHRRLERRDMKVKFEKAMWSTERKINSDKETRVHHYCKKPVHLRRYRRKLLASKAAGEDNLKNVSKNEEAKAAHSDSRSVAFNVGRKCSSWVIDIGASAHKTSNQSFFEKLREFPDGLITLADGKKVQIQGK